MQSVAPGSGNLQSVETLWTVGRSSLGPTRHCLRGLTLICHWFSSRRLLGGGWILIDPGSKELKSLLTRGRPIAQISGISPLLHSIGRPRMFFMPFKSIPAKLSNMPLPKADIASNTRFARLSDMTLLKTARANPGAQIRGIFCRGLLTMVTLQTQIQI